MAEIESRISRRKFIAAGAGGAAGAAVFAGAGCTEAPPSPAAPAPWHETPRIAGMLSRHLPRGDRVLPILGMGTPPIIPAFSALPEAQRIDVVRHAFERGIRYFDTAHSYASAPLLKAALSDVRDEVYLNTKTGRLDPEEARREIEEELDRLGTDHVDCAKLHNVGHSMYAEPVEELRDRYLPVIDALERMKQEGTVRAIGLSSHLNYELSFRLIDTGRLDELLISRGYFPKGMREIIWPRNMQWRDLTVARAHQLGMNIIGMKGLANVLYGHFRVQEDGDFQLGPRTMVPGYPEQKVRQLPGAALRWAFSDHRFHLYIVGMSVPADVDEDVALCSGDLALSNDDQLLLAEFSTRLWDADHVRGYETDVHPNYPAPPAPPSLQGARLRTRRAEPHADELRT